MPTRDHWLLLALAHRRGAPLTPVQVQKAMFLMRQEASSFVGTDFYTFVPYNYGPFDAQIYVDLENLQRQGLVTISGQGNVRTFSITALGIAQADNARSTADAKAVTYLENVVDWVASLNFSQLVRAIYARYPQFRVNSVFAG